MAAKKTQPAKTKPRSLKRITPERWDKFVEAYRETGVMYQACEKVGISRRVVWDERARNPEFDAKMQEAKEDYTDTLERVTLARARDGWDEPVFHEGVICGYKRKYSDTLAIFHLKALRPEKYRDNINIDHSLNVADDLASALEEAFNRSRGVTVDAEPLPAIDSQD